MHKTLRLHDDELDFIDAQGHPFTYTMLRAITACYAALQRDRAMARRFEDPKGPSVVKSLRIPADYWPVIKEIARLAGNNDINYILRLSLWVMREESR